MIQWKPEKRKVADLIHWEENPRKISDAKAVKLRSRIEARGFHDIIKIDTDNTILSGNMRKDVLESMGINEVTVLIPERKLTIEERVMVGLESNMNDGEWDSEELAHFETDMLLDAGFDQRQLNDILEINEVTSDHFDHKKAVEEATKKTRVQYGELYQLGDHRLLIGDSTEGIDVARLMDGQKADMIYCDPPYNIGLDYTKGVSTAGKYQGKVKAVELNDKKNDNDYRAFVEATLRNALDHVGKSAHVFYWCDEKYIGLFQRMFADNGVANKRVCLWIKNNQNPTPGLAFNKVYEPCVYGTIGRPALNKKYRNLTEVMNKEIGVGNQCIDDIMEMMNVWAVRRENATEYEHPTQKPTTLHEKPIKRCTNPGELIIELFGGSGSTLIAAEQLKRRAYLMETNRVFAQVIINRWEKLTGKKAVKL